MCNENNDSLRAIKEFVSEPKEDYIPLVVDLDGTLINSDLLYIGYIKLLRKNIFNLFISFLWLLRGRVAFKKKVFETIELEPEQLPYNRALLDFLQSEFLKGRKIILATASLRSIALEISKVHPIFNEVYGTENSINLKGKNKLKKLIERFGIKGFDYIGNSYADLVIFKSSRFSYLVNPNKRLEKKARKISILKKIWYKE